MVDGAQICVTEVVSKKLYVSGKVHNETGKLTLSRT